MAQAITVSLVLDLLAQYSDVVFLIGGMILNVMAGMALLDENTQFPRKQSLTYSAVLALMAATYLGMGMILSAGSFGLGGFVWLGIAIFRGA